MLPSGKTIEIVYFADEDVAPDTAPDRETSELHCCPGCASTLVYPTAWEEAGDSAWELALRCPNCLWEHTGVFTQRAVDGLDEQLDHGTQVLVRDLKQLMHANMESEIERFLIALEAGQIWPMDF